MSGVHGASGGMGRGGRLTGWVLTAVSVGCSMRAALGLCKIASIDIMEKKLLEEDTIPRLYDMITATLTDAAILDDTRRFAMECLAFLCANADIKVGRCRAVRVGARVTHAPSAY